MYDSENGEGGGGESIRFTSRKSDVGHEIISRVTFSIGLAHESRPKNLLCRKFERGSRAQHGGGEFIRKLLKVDRRASLRRKRW